MCRDFWLRWRLTDEKLFPSSQLFVASSIRRGPGGHAGLKASVFIKMARTGFSRIDLSNRLGANRHVLDLINGAAAPCLLSVCCQLGAHLYPLAIIERICQPFFMLPKFSISTQQKLKCSTGFTSGISGSKINNRLNSVSKNIDFWICSNQDENFGPQFWFG